MAEVDEARRRRDAYETELGAQTQTRRREDDGVDAPPVYGDPSGKTVPQPKLTYIRPVAGY